MCIAKMILQMRTIGSVLVLLLGFVGAPASHADEVLKVGKSHGDGAEFAGVFVLDLAAEAGSLSINPRFGE